MELNEATDRLNATCHTALRGPGRLIRWTDTKSPSFIRSQELNVTGMVRTFLLGSIILSTFQSWLHAQDEAKAVQVEIRPPIKAQPAAQFVPAVPLQAAEKVVRDAPAKPVEKKPAAKAKAGNEKKAKEAAQAAEALVEGGEVRAIAGVALEAAGEVVEGELLPAVAFAADDAAIAQTEPDFKHAEAFAKKLLVPRQSEWKYWDAENPPEDDWVKSEFDDSKWSSGKAVLGYGDTGLATTVSFGSDDQAKHPAAFFRLKFKAPKEVIDQPAIGRIINDDAAVVFLNGKEIFRRNLAADAGNDAFARSSSKPERRFWTFVIPPKTILEGDNCLAVRVHQRSGNSSDMIHEMEIVSSNQAAAKIAAKLQSRERLLFNGFNTGGKVLMAGNSTWKYRFGEKFEKDWFKLDFDDTQWKSGQAPLGFGENEIKTDLSVATDQGQAPAAGFFRHEFELTAEQAKQTWIAQLKFDDAAVFYVNEKELARYMMRDEGVIDDSTFAAEKISNEDHVWTLVLKPEHLRAGKNVIALSVHQDPASDSDLMALLVIRASTPQTVELATKIQTQEKGGNSAAGKMLNVPKPALIARKSKWKYWDKGKAPPKGWKTLAFDDAKWDEGAGPLGYGDSFIATEISPGEDTAKKNPTVYFRHTFEATDIASLHDAVGKVMHDDAVIVFVNGVEVFRRNLVDGFKEDKDFVKAGEGWTNGDGPEDVFGVKVYASGAYEQHYFTFAIEQGLIKLGKNVVAVHLQQCNPNSSDQAMDLELAMVDRTQMIADARIQARELVDDITFEQDEMVLAGNRAGGSVSMTHLSDGEQTFHMANNAEPQTVVYDAIVQAKTYAPTAKFARAMEGDTLQKLALRAGLDVEQLVLLNRTNKNKVFKEREIYLQAWEYTIQKGDTLEAIAKKISSKADNLAKINGLPVDAKLKTGEKLQIPGKFNHQIDSNYSYLQLAMYPWRSRVNTAPYTSTKQKSHKVKETDTLESIAKRYNVTVDFLCKMNKIDKDHELGERILIDYTLRIRKDRTLDEVATYLGVAVDDILEINNIKSAAELKPSQLVHIPYGERMGYNRVNNPNNFVVYEVTLGERKFKKAKQPNRFQPQPPPPEEKKPSAPPKQAIKLEAVPAPVVPAAQ